MANGSKKTSPSKKPVSARKKSIRSSSSKETNGKRTVARSSVSGRFVVAPESEGWTVKRVGSGRLRVFETQADAIAAATKTARDSKSDVVIHRKDGTIRDRVSTSVADSAMLKVWRSTHQANSSAKKR
ncbi:MAG: DUF2188 domain-containing protein [Pyrinomonadaceae bacterium]|nr:DUF2188 domain-containing protein [Pyrinomonadaceae bacterium]